MSIVMFATNFLKNVKSVETMARTQEKLTETKDSKERIEERKKDVLIIVDEQVEKVKVKNKAILEQKVEHLKIVVELNEELNAISQLEERLSPKYEGMKVANNSKEGSFKPEKTQAGGEKGNIIDKEIKIEKCLFPLNGTLLDFLFTPI